MRIGIDLGGTKIEGVLLADDGEILDRRRVPTPHDDYEATVGSTVELIRTLDAESKGKAKGEAKGKGQAKGPTPSVGIGMPGSVSTVTGAMKNCNSTCLNGRFFGREVSEALGREVAVANDADCFALSEAVDGAGAAGQRVFGAILGTGVGGGIVQDKRLLAGPNGLCGEWGHNLLPREAQIVEDPPRPCFCGHHDCIETYLSGPGLARTHRTLSGDDLGAPDIARLAADGDHAANRTLDVYVRQLAFALSQIINFLDPHFVVLGGGVSNIERIYDAACGVPAHWGSWVTSDAVETRLARARFGDSSGVRGAAWLPGID